VGGGDGERLWQREESTNGIPRGHSVARGARGSGCDVAGEQQPVANGAAIKADSAWACSCSPSSLTLQYSNSRVAGLPWIFSIRPTAHLSPEIHHESRVERFHVLSEASVRTLMLRGDGLGLASAQPVGPNATDGAAPATDASWKAALPSLGDDDDVHGQSSDGREHALDDCRDEVHRGTVRFLVLAVWRASVPRTQLST
jgi:hypothetical protein